MEYPMQISVNQLHRYEKDGFLFMPGLFSLREAALLKNEAERMLEQDAPGRVFEKKADVVRSVYGSHAHNALFRHLCAHPRLLAPAMRLLGDSVYVHQFKINAKAAFGGDAWEWHQDFIFWQLQDGMNRPDALTVAIFLDEVNEFNGPLILARASHHLGVLVPKNDMKDKRGTPDDSAEMWRSDVAARLSYALDQKTVARVVQEHELVAPKGAPGSALFFHCNIMHGSAPNISPFNRLVALITFNSVKNRLSPVAKPRPEFLASRSFEPLVMFPDEFHMAEERSTVRINGIARESASEPGVSRTEVGSPILHESRSAKQ